MRPHSGPVPPRRGLQPAPKKKSQVSTAKKRKLIKALAQAKKLKSPVKVAPKTVKPTSKANPKSSDKQLEGKATSPDRKREPLQKTKSELKKGKSDTASAKKIIVKPDLKGKVIVKKGKGVPVKKIQLLNRKNMSLKKKIIKKVVPSSSGKNIKSNSTKEPGPQKFTPVKKLSTATEKVETGETVKERSRSPEKKKRTGALRSSSAPLMPTTGNEDSSNVDSSSLATSRATKISSEDVTPGKSASKKPSKLLEPPKISPSKAKETEHKTTEKGVSKTETMDIWLDDHKKLDPKDSAISVKTPFLDSQLLAPLGRKRLVGKVKPIARVKGTVIEKVKTEAEKRKTNASPAKSIEEKGSVERESVDKSKLELEKKRAAAKLTDEAKSTEKDTAKGSKVKKTDEEKPVTGSSTKVMIVQPDLLCPLAEKSVVKDSLQKVKDTPSPKKPLGLNKSRQLGSKAIKASAIVKKKLIMVKKSKVAKKVIESLSNSKKSGDDTESEDLTITYSFPEDSVLLESSDKKKSNVGKNSTANVPKLNKNIPKKIKLDKNEESSEDIQKKSSKVVDELIDVKFKLPKSATKEESSSISKDHDVDVELSLPSHEVLKPKKAQPSPSKATKECLDDGNNKNENIEKKDTVSANSKKNETEKFVIPKLKTGEKSRVSSPSGKSKSTSKTTFPTRPLKKFISLPTEDKARTKLVGFWSGPKRHREASLNALAKVQCLYENESRTHMELGLMRTVDRGPQKWRETPKKKAIKTEKWDAGSSDSDYDKNIKSEFNSSEDDSNPPTTRTLRIQPGSRGSGKYWDMKTSSSEESEAEHRRQYTEKKKVMTKPKIVVKAEKDVSTETKLEIAKAKKAEGPTAKKRRNRTEVVMDLKDMVVRKRMASLNATAILAASYEKRSPKSKDETTTSSESTSSEQEDIKPKRKALALRETAGECSKDFSYKAAEVKAAAKLKTVIVNQEADVTFTTGVYSHHHEGFCTVSGMQYRISSTSHTQTTATAAADKEPLAGGSGASYTPLGALSSMHPPGGIPSSHPHQGSGLPEVRGPSGAGGLGRRAGCSSAFSAPPHHHADHHQDRSAPGYYQPAGPLISAGPLHGGFKDAAGGAGAGQGQGAGPGPGAPPDPPPFARYQYPQPQPVMHYGGGFSAPHAQYGGAAHYAPPPDACYGAGAARTACYRTPPSRTAHYRAPPAPDNQVSPTGADAYAPQFCPPCYQHPHGPSRPSMAYIDNAYQGCPCPMQSCPKNVHTGPATGNPPAGGGPNTFSPPGGSRAPRSAPAASFQSLAKDPPLLNRVLKNECSVKNGPDLRSVVQDSGALVGARSPKREYFPETTGRGRQDSADGRNGCCAVALNPSLSVVPPESLGPPSPARGSAGASIPQPPDPPHRPPLLSTHPPRKARLGKAMARKSIGADDAGHTTMLLMCRPRIASDPASPPPGVMTPLQVDTQSPPEKVEDVKNEIDSGDEVILLDSPRSKMAPIDVSSSEDNCTDSKSEKDCMISRKDTNDEIVDLSIDTKKENSDRPENSPLRKNGSLFSDLQALKEHNVDKITSSPENLKKSPEKNNSVTEDKFIDIKPKIGTKRRSSQPKLEIDLNMDVNRKLATNGIGEHVKLQKRQKVSTISQQNKKNTSTGTYKDLIRKNDKVFKLNNGKRQLNTVKPDKYKALAKGMNLIDSDKSQFKKVATKAKGVGVITSEPPAKKRKTNSLLKTDKKQSENAAEKVQTSKKNLLSSAPKAKSATLLDNLFLKNNVDMSIENVVKNIDGEATLPLNNTSKSSHSLSAYVMKSKKCNAVCSDPPTKGRTVLNINNNVVKKVAEAIAQAPPAKTERKLSVEKQARTKSKSPAAVNRKGDKKEMKTKGQTENQKDLKVAKVDATKKKAGKSQLGVTTKGGAAKRKSKSCDVLDPVDDAAQALRRSLSTPRWSNGWAWEGEPQQGRVFVNNEEMRIVARTWTAMRHTHAGDSVRRGDCVLLRAGARRTEAPFVARVATLWENPDDGEMMVSLLWYYRPEHTEQGRQPGDCTEEVFASRHRDVNSVACIEDKCYVLTFNEYCRYRKQLKAIEEGIQIPLSVVPNMPAHEITPAMVTNDGRVPLNTSADLVLFSRRVYDFRLKKIIMKNPPIV